VTGDHSVNETRATLHTLEAAALRTAAVAGEAYEEAAAVPSFRPDMGAPLRGGVPDAPLVSAVGDLAAAAHAAARAIHFVVAATPPHHPAATATLAGAVTGAAELAVRAAALRDDLAGIRLRVELAHAAALAAHSAADALSDDEGRSPASGPRRTDARWLRSPVVAFPASSRRLIRLLSEHIGSETARYGGREAGLDHGSVHARLAAACAARDAAEHAMRAYDRCHVTSAPVRVTCRVARLASRASAHAGFAVLKLPMETGWL